MTITGIILLVYFLLGGLYWVAMIRSMRLFVARTPVLAALDLPMPTDWPRLSVVVPACNEEAEIEKAAISLLSQDYPDLEVILVDDRSTDRTPEIIDRLAAGGPDVKAVHIAHLPDGWLGKVHALDEGLRCATGRWVLFTDADVHFAPGMLRKSVAYALDQKLDHLAAMPQLWSSGLLVDSAIFSFLRQLVLALRLWKVNDPVAGVFMGVGAFNLVRREAFDRTLGFEWLRLEVGDDVGLALLMHRHGGRGGLVSAVGLLGLYWYRNLTQAARGVEKGFASVGNCSLLRVVSLSACLLALELSMFAAMIPLGLPGAPFAAAAIFAAYLLAAWRTSRWAGTKFVPALLAPVAAVLMAAMTLRSGILGFLRGGMIWRGTLYPNKLMRNSTKVKFPL